MIDVFLRWYPRNTIRERMGWLVQDRLMMMKEIKLYPVPVELCGEPYHINSKKYVEEHAESEIYCVMDDDQLPISDHFFTFGMGTLIENPEYGMLAGFPLEYLRYGQPYAARTEPVIEAHSIGCPYFVRKGTLKHFPNSPIHMYDGDLSKVVTDQGLKTGFARYALYNHLGYGFTSVGNIKQ